MRKLFPLVGLGCAGIIVLGMIGSGITLLVYGVQPFWEKLSSKKTDPQAGPNGEPKAPFPAPGPLDVNPGMIAVPMETKNLREARRGHRTEIFPRAGRDQQHSLAKDVAGAQVVDYGPDEPRAAYISLDPKDNRKHPAVVWAHSGTSGVSEQLWKSLAVFREAGFVVLAPTFRGEQRNPGEFELFYGEVDDLLHAVDYVADQAYVDPERIYVIGQKGGGTLALLAATTGPTPARAFLALSPIADMEEFVRQRMPQKDSPFKLSNPDESRLRSPMRFARFIETPTFSFNSLNPPLQAEQSQRMLVAAQRANVPFHAFSIPKATPDDMDKLNPLFVEKLLSDKGEKCNITFDDAELAAVFAK